MELCVCVPLSVSGMWSRDERVHNHLYLHNQLNDLYLCPYSESAGLKQEEGGGLLLILV